MSLSDPAPPKKYHASQTASILAFSHNDHTEEALNPITAQEEMELATHTQLDGRVDASTPQPTIDIPLATTRRLYISHFLSTWNSRSFEFGAVLFLASIYPETLLMLSIYALVRSASAIFFAPVIGRVIDARGRLSVVRLSIS